MLHIAVVRKFPEEMINFFLETDDETARKLLNQQVPQSSSSSFSSSSSSSSVTRAPCTLNARSHPRPETRGWNRGATPLCHLRLPEVAGGTPLQAAGGRRLSQVAGEFFVNDT